MKQPHLKYIEDEQIPVYLVSKVALFSDKRPSATLKFEVYLHEPDKVSFVCEVVREVEIKSPMTNLIRAFLSAVFRFQRIVVN